MALTVKNAVLRVGGISGAASATYEFSSKVDQVVFTPSSSTVTWTAIDGTTYSETSPSTWTADIQFLQDWDDENSLGRLLFDHEGAEATLTFEPLSGGVSVVTTATLSPGAIGGTAGSVATSSVSLGCSKPVFSA